jgi:hypothetical protein
MRDPGGAGIVRVSLDMFMAQDQRMAGHQGIGTDMNPLGIDLIQKKVALKDDPFFDVFVSTHACETETPGLNQLGENFHDSDSNIHNLPLIIF